MRSRTLKRAVALAGLAALAMAIVASQAQQAGFRRNLLQQADLSVPGREVVQARVEIDPGAVVARHTHPGEEVTYVIDGSLTLEVDGAAPKTYGKGEVFIVPAGTIHGARNAAGGVATILATYIVEKGKPLATPAK